MNQETNQILALQTKIVNDFFKASAALESVEKTLVAISFFLEESNRLHEKSENNTLHNMETVN